MPSVASDPSSVLPSAVAFIENGSSIVTWGNLVAASTELRVQPKAVIIRPPSVGDQLRLYQRRALPLALLFACGRCIRWTDIQKPTLQRPLASNCSDTLENDLGEVQYSGKQISGHTCRFHDNKPNWRWLRLPDLYSTWSWSVKKKKKKKIVSSTY